MEHSVKRSSNFLSLVSKFETTLKNGDTHYLDEKTFTDLIDYYRNIDQPKLALQAVENALTQYPFRSDFYIIKVKLLFHSGDASNALDVIFHAESLHPGDVELQMLKAQSYAKLQYFDEAFNIIKELKRVTFNQELVEVLFCEASLYEITKDFDKAFLKLQTVLDSNPNHPDALERIWLCVEMTKRYKESITFHQSLIDLDAYNHLAWYNLGHAYACVGRYIESIDALEYSFLVDPSFLLGYHDCAELCLEIRKFKRALGIYQEMYERFGPDSDVLVKLGLCHIKLNNSEKALKVLTTAVKLDSYHDEALFYLAECYKHFGNYNKALKLYHQAIELEDGREEYYASLAETYSLIKEFTKAHFYFRKATEIGPEDHRIWVAHATFLYKIGEQNKALEILEEADLHSVGSDLDYCRAACMISSESTREEGLKLLNTIMSEDFCEYNSLFDFAPALKSDDKINSMIKYYSGH